jgi:hypothetical protein
MAHFAKINNGTVSQVIVVSNDDCAGGNFPESEAAGQAFIASLGSQANGSRPHTTATFVAHTQVSATSMMLSPTHSHHQKATPMKLSKQHQEAVKSYLRSATAAVVAVIATLDYEPMDLAKAFVAALIPPVLRWINPKDTTFGRGSDGEEA